MSNAVTSLPPDFLQWVEKLPEVHLVQFKDHEWQFWTVEELQSPAHVNKVTTTHMSVLAGFVTMYRGMGLTSAKGAGGKPFPYEKLERCLTLATDNEYYLIVDPEDAYSVWKFCPDYARCGEVKPVASSLTLFLEEAKIEDGDDESWDDDL